MANGKSQVIGFIMLFVGIIIATAFIGDIADQVAAQRTLGTALNETHAAGTGNVSVAIQGREFISGAIVTNESNGVVISGFTIDTRTLSGATTVALTPNDTAIREAGANVNTSYTFRPDGFVGGSAGNIVLLITIFSALAIVTFAIAGLFKDTGMGDLIQRFR